MIASMTETAEIRALTDVELDDVNGGIAPIVVFAAIAGAVLGSGAAVGTWYLAKAAA